MKIPEEFWEDQEWGFKNHTKLLEKYKDKWVAIFNKKIVSSGKNLNKVENEATEKSHRKFIPVMFVDSGTNIY